MDHIHGVVEKMGVDLGLQGVELSDSLFLGNPLLFGHKRVDAAGHIVVGIHQLAHLILIGRGGHGRGGIVGFDLGHLGGDLADSPDDRPGQKLGDENTADHADENDGEIAQDDLIALADQAALGDDDHQIPGGAGDPVEGGVDIGSEDIFLDKGVGGLQIVGDLAIVDAVGGGPGPVGLGDDLIAVVDQIGDPVGKGQIVAQGLSVEA